MNLFNSSSNNNNLFQNQSQNLFGMNSLNSNQQRTGMLMQNQPTNINSNFNNFSNSNQNAHKSLISQSMRIDINQRQSGIQNFSSNDHLRSTQRQRIKTNDKNYIDPKYKTIVDPIFGSAQFNLIYQQGDQKVKDLGDQRKNQVVQVNALIESQNKKVDSLITKSQNVEQLIKDTLLPELYFIQKKILQQNSWLIGLTVKHQKIESEFEELKNILKNQNIHIKNIQQSIYKEDQCPTKNFQKLKFFVDEKIYLTKKILHEIFSLEKEQNGFNKDNLDQQLEWSQVEQTTHILVNITQNLKNEVYQLQDFYQRMTGKTILQNSQQDSSYLDLYESAVKVGQSDNQFIQQRTHQINNNEAGNLERNISG